MRSAQIARSITVEEARPEVGLPPVTAGGRAFSRSFCATRLAFVGVAWAGCVIGARVRGLPLGEVLSLRERPSTGRCQEPARSLARLRGRSVRARDLVCLMASGRRA